MTKLIYISRTGSRYEQDEERFLLRNGQRDWFKNGKEFIYADFVERDRIVNRYHLGYCRVHDVRVSEFGSIREFLQEGVYLFGMSKTRLEELEVLFGVKGVKEVHQFMHQQDPTQEYPFSIQSSTIVDFLEK